MMWRTGRAYMNETLVHERVFFAKQRVRTAIHGIATPRN